MKVCVTGGAGFIGSHLVDRLLRDGHEVAVLDNRSTGRLENLAHVRSEIRLVGGDLRDADAVASAVVGAEVIFHQAALASVTRSLQRSEEVTAVNVGGTLNVLLAAREAGSRRVIFASSSSVYGDTPTLPKVESMPLRPRSPYAASKCAGEAYLQAFTGTHGLETVAFRYFNVYGPRQRSDSHYAAAIPIFIEAMSEGRSPLIHGDGQQTRDFTFVHDAVEAVTRSALAEGTPEGPCNIGSGGPRTSINQLAAVIAKAVGFQGEIHHGPAREGEVRDSLADISAVSAWLDWRPKVSLAAGISATVAAFKAEEQALGRASHPQAR